MKTTHPTSMEPRASFILLQRGRVPWRTMAADSNSIHIEWVY